MTTTTLCLALALFLAPALAGAQEVLVATFDDKPIDVAIGTGGAALGEPISVSGAISAVVRSAPMATPALEIQDASASTAGSARFEFLGGQEIDSGMVRVGVDVQAPDVLSNLAIGCREAGSSVHVFGSVTMGPDGLIWGSDGTGGTGGLVPYPLGTTFHLELVFDMADGTWDLYLDGVLVLDDRPHGVAGSGLGAVLVGSEWDSDLVGTAYVDTLIVETLLFLDGFESADTGAWSSATRTR